MRLCELGFEPVELDDFYDVQVRQRAHVRRMRLSPVRLTVDLGDGALVVLDGACDVCLWTIGFGVVRFSARGDGVLSERLDERLTMLMRLSDESTPRATRWIFDVDGRPFAVSGGARRFFDWIGFMVHERLMRRPADPGRAAVFASSFDAAHEHAEALHARGELRFVYPNTFGSHLELACGALPRTASSWLRALATPEGANAAGACEILEQDDPRFWATSEVYSVLASPLTVDPVGSRAPSPAADDSTVVQVLEYAALRRGALTAVQRAAQRATAESRGVPRRELSEWMWLTAAVTDDHVLGGWSAGVLERFKHATQGTGRMRSMADLEDRVRRSIDGFLGRLDAESARTGTAIAVLFGIVAATSLVPLVQVLISRLIGWDGRSQDFPDAHPLAYVTMTTLLLVATAAAGALMLYRVRRLRPPRRTKRRSVALWNRAGWREKSPPGSRSRSPSRTRES